MEKPDSVSDMFIKWVTHVLKFPAQQLGELAACSGTERIKSLEFYWKRDGAEFSLL